jgi:uncharacterized protein (TIGR03066 family)
MHNGNPDPSQVPPQQPAAPARNWRPLRFLLLLLVGSAVISFVVFRYVAPRIPRELVGTWQVTDGDLKGATLEFRWYGTGIAGKANQGKMEFLESSVRVRGKRIVMTYTGLKAGMDETVIQTILKLTDDELVIRDEDEHVYHLVRIRD